MRKDILRLLEKGKELHEELISLYDNALPASILLEGNKIVEIKLPEKVNGLLAILNADAKAKKYTSVRNLDQAIGLFSSLEVQDDMNKALFNKELIGLSPCEDCFITIKEMFDAIQVEIQSLVDELNRQTCQCKAVQL